MPVTPATEPRHILCVFPRYAPSFGTFQYAFPLTGGVRAFMPPQGLLVIAAALPPSWQVRFIDENIGTATSEDFRWADAVFVSGMHIQQRQIEDICRRTHAHNRTAVLGGPSVSAAPERHPDFDYLHVGEIGDATEELFTRLGRDPSRPGRQIVLTTCERRALTDFPLPAYELVPLGRYFIGSVQFSSGCPYQCEFCDIPELYGRNPRLKSPQQILAELDKLLVCGCGGAVYFVDDNFIANRRAVRELLPHLVDWQKRNGYPFYLSCEATLNIAKRPDLLELMRQAAFGTVFCGIETPDPAALDAMGKKHNLMVPILDAIKTLNRYGIEVVSGIILGLDTDNLESGNALLDFIELSQIPMLTINLLQALPRTPLWDRLAREGRLVEDETRESNVDFLLPYEDMLAMWRSCMEKAYAPQALFARYAYQVRETYANRLKLPNSRQRTSWRNIRFGLTLLRNILWKVGICGDYRREFWRFAWPRLKCGDIESVIAVGMVAHHLIVFAREAVDGRHAASHYTARIEAAEAIAAE